MQKNTNSIYLPKLWFAVPKWWKCPQCGQWNTFVEEIIKKTTSNTSKVVNNKINKPQLICDIDYSNEKRIVCTDNELNRVLGGGVPGSLVLLGGDPGIGKSTLCYNLLLAIKKENFICFRWRKWKTN